MTEVMIDEYELTALSDAVLTLSKRLNEEAMKITNKDEDIFNRYMSYSRMRAFIDFSEVIFKTTKHLLICGHDINHPLINTEEAKKKGWGKSNIENNPFFTTKDQKQNHDELNCAVKSLLTALFKAKNDVGESKKESTH